MKSIEINTLDMNSELKSLFKSKIPYVIKDVLNIYEKEQNLIVNVSSDNVAEMTQRLWDFKKSLVDNYKEVKTISLFNYEPVTIPNEKCIYEDLVKYGWVIEYGNGLIGFGKGFLKLYNYFDNIFLGWARKLNANEYFYPDLISIETLNKYNYLSQYPNQMVFASHLKEDLNLIDDFTRRYSQGGDCFTDHYIEKPKYVNKSSICIHTYQQYENKEIDLNEPIVITSIGKCKRYESINMTRLERLFDFTMREIIFIGSKEFVLKQREEVISWAKNLITKLSVKASIVTSNDPFFMNDYKSKAEMQKKFKLKYELNFHLPYNNTELAVGSFNYHGTHFSDIFNIKSKDRRQVHTSCVGFGIERIVYAYLSQFGLDVVKNFDGGVS